MQVEGRPSEVSFIGDVLNRDGIVALFEDQADEGVLQAYDEVVQIEAGSEVTIRFDALPDETFAGEVDSISEYFVEQYGEITYVVRIRLLESDDQLRWGMTAEVSFLD